MKLIYTISLSLFLSASVFGQKTEKAGPKDKAVIEHFKNDYKKKNYKKFDGKMTLNDNQILFDNKIIFYDKADKITETMLKEGLIYPQLLTEFQVDKFENEDSDRTQKRFAKIQKNWKDSFEVNNIKLSGGSELSFLSTDEKVKRFKVVCKDPKFPNLMIYYFELTNKNATKDTSVQDFIKNSKLTHIFQRTE
ncbi:hypothetical protein QX233_09970 [Chryseobacterium gambrini]|uniref:Uncharacterized protein n=1 Tax=Chryseobacterium gambrini TaxID=373672 RepID=A0AAJ1R755_9FLAO|nr:MULTISPECIES: hypothetical protein [Chryseobacterium]MDN4012788.1 hypothetical protein [Chryseobacterium gambrini]MDN4030328.1 hypothetical protein [Chryseobacterium gambrini]QWA39387.1 hypothetical protein KKI44_04020 [Chryseobacterium sp. ZHDP1]